MKIEIIHSINHMEEVLPTKKVLGKEIMENVKKIAILIILLVSSCTWGGKEIKGIEATSVVTDEVDTVDATKISFSPDQPIGDSKETSLVEDCIPPLVSFSVPIITLDISKCSNRSCLFPETDPILPGKPWERAASLPDGEGQKWDNGWRNVQLAGLREKDEGTEIWLFERGNVDDDASMSYYIHNTQTTTWMKINAEPEFDEETSNYVSELYITSDGEVWGVNNDGGEKIRNGENNPIPLLSFYNDEKQKFVYDMKSEKLNNIGLQQSKYDLVFDPKGVLWILKGGDGIYKYELASGNLTKEISLGEGYIHAGKLAPDGDIYFKFDILDKDKFDAETGFFIQDGQLYFYSPEEKRLNTLIVPSEGRYTNDNSVFSRFLFDQDGRLWILNKVYRDKSGQWNKIMDQPLFYTDNWIDEYPVGRITEVDKLYNWYYLYPYSASSDGNVWFIGEEGTFRGNATDGSWCWVTTEKSIVQEESDGKLWMVAGGNLYSRSIKKE